MHQNLGMLRTKLCTDFLKASLHIDELLHRIAPHISTNAKISEMHRPGIHNHQILNTWCMYIIVLTFQRMVHSDWMLATLKFVPLYLISLFQKYRSIYTNKIDGLKKMWSHSTIELQKIGVINRTILVLNKTY